LSQDVQRLAMRIRAEIPELERTCARCEKGWQSATRSGDDLYLDSVALNLHGFYDGLEGLAKKIALTIDGEVPSGANWHELLLEKMAGEIEGIRPAVLSAGTRGELDAYRGFRHVVRNVYAFNINPEKLGALVFGLPDALKAVRAELLAFADFLDDAAGGER